MSAGERNAFPAWWESRTPRERVLLLIMAALIAAMGFWFAVVAPLRNAEAAAEERYARAVTRLMSVSATTEEVAALQAVRSSGASSQALAQVVVQTALANGVALSRQTPAPGGLAVTIETADPGSAFRWIASLQRDHGVSVSILVLGRNPDRSLRLQVKFAGGRL